MLSIQNAIISVADKRGLDSFCRFLINRGVNIYSSGGTYKYMKNIIGDTPLLHSISSLTSYPHLVGGRVKTLHPKVHAGILANRGLTEHITDCVEHDIPLFDMVVVNLYPFQEKLSQGVEHQEMIENIDIGGHTLIRAAAKNYSDVLVCTDPKDYGNIVSKYDNISLEYRLECSVKAYHHITEYDQAISMYLSSDREYRTLYHPFELKYGVNPHQKNAIVYSLHPDSSPFQVLNGKLGYINVLDAVYSWNLVHRASKVLDCPVAASFKHNSPAGVGTSRPLSEVLEKIYNVSGRELSECAVAYIRARNGDPMSSFGDFVALSHTVDVSTANLIKREVSDGIIAPDYEPEALAILRNKKKGRFIILKAENLVIPTKREYREVCGVGLSQETNNHILTKDLFNDVECSTKRKELTDEQRENLLLATATLQYTQSNSVCLAYDGQIIGVGAGQQNRVDCVRLCSEKAKTWYLRTHPKVLKLYYLFKSSVKRQQKINAIIDYIRNEFTKESYKKWTEQFAIVPEPLTNEEKDKYILTLSNVSLSSDAFFPFRDSIDYAKQVGVETIIQPGGSIQDENVIEACNEYGMAMIFSGVRYFTH